LSRVEEGIVQHLFYYPTGEILMRILQRILKFTVFVAAGQAGFQGIANAQDCTAPVHVDSACSVSKESNDCFVYKYDGAGHMIWPVDEIPGAWVCSGTKDYGHLLLCPGATSWIQTHLDTDEIPLFAIKNCKGVSSQIKKNDTDCKAKAPLPSGWVQNSPFVLKDGFMTTKGICLSGTLSRDVMFEVGSVNAGWKRQGVWCKEESAVAFWPNGQLKTCIMPRVLLETAPRGEVCEADKRAWFDSKGNLQNCN
jgi:hypothetical protein